MHKLNFDVMCPWQGISHEKCECIWEITFERPLDYNFFMHNGYSWKRNVLSKLQRRLLLELNYVTLVLYIYVLVAVGSSGILKVKQKLGVTFNFNKQDETSLILRNFQKWQRAGPQKQIHKSSRRSFVFWAKKIIKGCFLINNLKEIQ